MIKGDDVMKMDKVIIALILAIITGYFYSSYVKSINNTRPLQLKTHKVSIPIKKYRVLIFTNESTSYINKRFAQPQFLISYPVEEILFLNEPSREKQFEQFRINDFPTIILLDENNKIMLRSREIDPVIKFLKSKNISKQYW